MLLTVLDATSTSQKIITKGQEAIVDSSGTIAVTDMAQTATSASSTRSGFFFQNLGANDMWFSDLGTATKLPGSIKIAAGTSLSAPRDIPVNTNALSIIGTAGDGYTLRVW